MVTECGQNVVRGDDERSHDAPNHGGRFLTFSRSDESEIYQTVRLAPNTSSDSSVYLGLLSYNTASGVQTFRLSNVDSDDTVGARNSLSISSKNRLNDFAFSNVPSSSGGVSKIAFSPTVGRGAEDRRHPVILDVASTIVSPAVRARDRVLFRSDTLRVEYQGNDRILYGHRNGDVSVVDVRSGAVTHALGSNLADHRFGVGGAMASGGATSFGSVSSVRALRRGGGNESSSSDTMILARGSFGSCLLFDLRRHASNEDRRSSSSAASCGDHDPRPRSLLRRMKVPVDHNIDPVSSARCSGLVVDPDETVCLSPVVCDEEQGRRASLAVWSLETGAYVGKRVIPAGADELHDERSSRATYCELSEVLTSAWQLKSSSKACDDVSFSVRETPGSMGTWMKSNSIRGGDFPSCLGCIHHAVFPGKSPHNL